MTGTKVVKLRLEDSGGKLPALIGDKVDEAAVGKAVELFYAEVPDIPLQGIDVQKDVAYYEKMVDATRDFNVTTEQLTEIVSKIEDDQRLRLKTAHVMGMYFTALMNNSKHPYFEIKTRENMWYLGMRMKDDKTAVLKGKGGRHVGYEMEHGTLIVEGNTGAYTGQHMKGGQLILKDYSGDALGEWMQGGSIMAEADVGKYAGRHMRGGSLTVKGKSDDYTGMQMINGIIRIGKDAGSWTGDGMRGGKITVDGKIRHLGYDMTGGEIWQGNEKVWPREK
ncbi:MAG: hypothetical protein V1921_06475 [Candidatus Altiarchaeota archaeon]